MSKTQQKTIRGREYAFGIIPPIEAIEVEVAIGQVIGEPLFASLMQIDNNKAEGGTTKEEFFQIAGTAIGLMTSKMEAKKLIATMETVFKYVSCDGERININSTFAGRNRELWEVFIEAIKHNFADFLPASLSDSIPAGILKK